MSGTERHRDSFTKRRPQPSGRGWVRPALTLLALVRCLAPTAAVYESSNAAKMAAPPGHRDTSE